MVMWVIHRLDSTAAHLGTIAGELPTVAVGVRNVALSAIVRRPTLSMVLMVGAMRMYT